MEHQHQRRRRRRSKSTIRHHRQERRRFDSVNQTYFLAVKVVVKLLTVGICCFFLTLSPIQFVHGFVVFKTSSSTLSFHTSRSSFNQETFSRQVPRKSNQQTFSRQVPRKSGGLSSKETRLASPFQLAASRADNENNNVHNQVDKETIHHHYHIKPTTTNSRPSTSSWKNAFAQTALITSIVFTSLVGIFPNVANAGFGPSGGATTSPTAGLSTPKIQVQDLDNMRIGGKNNNKVQQLIGSTIDESRLDEFQSQLDLLIDSINNYIINDLQADDDNTDQQQQQVEKTRGGRQQQLERPEAEAEESDSSISSGNYEEISNRLETRVTVQEEIQRLEKAKSLRELVSKRDKLLESLEAQPLWFNYLAAFCGSVASTLVMHPVDTIKTRLQVPNTTSTTTTTSTSMIADDGNHDMKNRRHILSGHNEITAAATTIDGTSTTTTGQFENLYEGLTGNILKEGPPSALYLGVYETVKSSLIHGPYAGAFATFLGMASTATTGAGSAAAGITTTTNPMYLLWIYLLAGAAGETVGSVIRAPAEALKSTVQTGTASSFKEAFSKVILDDDGRCNVYRAWSASLWRDVPFGAIQLAIFELIKAAILNNPNIDFDSSTLQSEAIIGAFAGGCGAFLTNPTDVITTRIITQSVANDNDDDDDSNEHLDDGSSGTNGGGPLGVFGMGRLIYEEGGIGAFFAGWQARVLYWAPAISLFLTCYCSVRQLGVRVEWFGP